ncbi:electron transport complex subunit RsxD [Psychrobium sp. 1_MG-2023]|uniref:electron transport complex subunit RsxD n=1 Tax=Psychrobium sp. 1_MG-2023 TaxID=3062624 RepID=UPI000C334DF3|nr:electron transport complex subunit RsxD [Psychrobium sp. 1_MG-2023]MDP2562902.1 electron transport complex subunit RsxD [Psychrobium sp. 1_MG-2023]PKF54039.1 electron transport complex subunit RsxD [Alteromonadales bacterium alter-6D02]
MFLSVTPSPHKVGQANTAKMMRNVALATLPGIIALMYFFGFGVLIQLVICMLTAVITEALILKVRKKPISLTLKDNSALLTGLLLGISIPPLAPWWIGALGVSFAIIVAKQLYGGLGFNLFNPAMIGYVLLLISFPLQMTTWQVPFEVAQHSLSFIDELSAVFSGYTTSGVSVNDLRLTVDGITMATPLDSLKTDLTQGLTSSEATNKPAYSTMAGLGWEWVNLAFLLGGLILLKLKMIRWHIPVAMLSSLFLCTLIGYLLAPDSHGTPVFHLLSGATMLGAFFIATDPVTAATSNKGRLIFGALIGVLIYIIRNFGGFPDAIAFAVLLANMTVPVIDYYTKPVSYGSANHRKEVNDE